MENNERNQSSTNYSLKSDAVDALVDAESGVVREFSEEELKRYRSNKGFKLPDVVKLLLIKLWFAGAVYYFIGFSLGADLPTIDLLIVLSVVYGMVTDLLTNNVIRFIEQTEGSNDKWMLLPKKGMVSFFLNILYCGVIIVCVYGLYYLINYTANVITGEAKAIHLGVEPVLFGVFCMGFDMLFISIKNLILRVVSGRKQ